MSPEEEKSFDNYRKSLEEASKDQYENRLRYLRRVAKEQASLNEMQTTETPESKSSEDEEQSETYEQRLRMLRKVKRLQKAQKTAKRAKQAVKTANTVLKVAKLLRLGGTLATILYYAAIAFLIIFGTAILIAILLYIMCTGFVSGIAMRSLTDVCETMHIPLYESIPVIKNIIHWIKSSKS